MNELRLDDILRDIHDERADLPDAPTVRGRLLEVPLQDLPQERRWIPAWLSGTPGSFFGGLKLAAAAAIVAVFGAFLLLGVLLPSRDDEPAATPTPVPTETAEPTPSALLEAAPVTGRADVGGLEVEGTVSSEDGVTYRFDDRTTLDLESSDPRLTGQATIRSNTHEHERLGLSLGASTIELVTTDGRWTGEGGSLTAGDTAMTTFLLRGEEGYEGLSAYVALADGGDEPSTLRAAVFPGEMPVYGGKPVAKEPDESMRAPTAADLEPGLASGTISFPSVVVGGSRQWDGSRINGSGLYEQHTIESSDPRLSGKLLSASDHIDYESLGIYLADGESVLDTDDGRWVGEFDFIGGLDELQGTATVILRGEGPYEGLWTYLVGDFAAMPITFTAAIVEGPLPTPPEPT